MNKNLLSVQKNDRLKLEMLQDLEFYKSQSMLDDFEINRLRCELKTTTDNVEQERADSWAIILGLASGVVGLASGTLAASAMAVETGALAAAGSTAVMFGTTTAAASTAAATASAATASMIGTGAAVSVAAETAAVGAALSCVIS